MNCKEMLQKLFLEYPRDFFMNSPGNWSNELEYSSPDIPRDLSSGVLQKLLQKLSGGFIRNYQDILPKIFQEYLNKHFHEFLQEISMESFRNSPRNSPRIPPGILRDFLNKIQDFCPTEISSGFLQDSPRIPPRIHPEFKNMPGIPCHIYARKTFLGISPGICQGFFQKFLQTLPKDSSGKLIQKFSRNFREMLQKFFQEFPRDFSKKSLKISSEIHHRFLRQIK